MGAMCVAGTLELVEVVEDLVEKTGWHIWLSAQTTGIVIGALKKGDMSVEIMMVSMAFIIKSFELIDVFCFYFLVLVFLDSIDE